MAVDLANYEISEEAFDLRDLLQGVLDRVVASFTSYGMPLPLRRYWTMGTPASDCEQVVVTFVQMYLGLPGDEASQPQRCNQPRSAIVSVSVTRSIPVVGSNGKPPLAQSIQKESEVSAVDAWILMQSVSVMDQWDSSGVLGPGVIATVESTEPSGGLQTINLQLTLTVP